MEYKILKLKGAILSKSQLESYLEKIASDHNLQNYSIKSTYPIPRLKENLEVIHEVYKLLNEHIKLKIPIHPAGEWILDNYYVIDETVKAIKNTLTLKKYTHFVGLSNETYSGFARIYVLAAEIVNYTDNNIETKDLSSLLKAYQKKKLLTMEEIWNFPMFLQIALIENIRQICERIASAQMQKYKVENIIERLVEQKNKEELQYTHLGEYKAKVKGFEEMKYPFIEHLSYRLKKYGRKAYPYLTILEEQINRMGMDLNEVVEKEHFALAKNKVSIGNAITSIKNLNRISMSEIFEETNEVEDILKQDPLNVYEKMDYETKSLYRNKIHEISKKTNNSEIYVAKKVLELAKESNKHVGYYLLSNGKNTLQTILTGKPKKEITTKQKSIIYISLVGILTIILSSIFGVYMYNQTKNILFSILLILLLLIPSQNIIMQIIQYILGKFVKPKPIPKLDFSKGIPSEYATFVVIPTILNNKEKVDKIMNNLETYYLANQSDNIYFALLGDCTSGKNEKEPFDEEIINEGLKKVEELNEIYKDSSFPKFHFLYRKRTWNSKEECYLGWERKRGLLNEFNEYILEKTKNNFLANTIEKHPKIKYVITLDADTELTLNTGLELVSAMAHPLNTPVLNERKDLVIDGHALIQPRVGINLQDTKKSIFTKIYAGLGGKDAYTNAISDTYQDNFEEGIFTGKGIYDVEIFSQVLANEIPENTVLSHDLLEGSYLRCGLASDIMLMDGYPTGYNSFKARLHRWIRGDWQIIGWLGNSIRNKYGEKKHNPLNLLSKYKILDNLLRSMLEISIVVGLIYISLINLKYNIKIAPIVSLYIISSIMPTVLELLNHIIFKKEEETLQKTFIQNFSVVKASIIRGMLAISSLPDKAYFSANAIVKTLYRKFISKKNFLEWTTAEDAEKSAKKDVVSYYKNMFANIILGALAIVLLFLLSKNISSIFIFLLACMWLVAPAVFCKISKETKQKPKLEELNVEEKEYLFTLGKKTWQYFKDFLKEERNFLPPDNYQEDRKEKIKEQTSPTNIGLSLLAVVSSYDLGYENLDDTINLLEKMLTTIQNLPKWNGHLYNWYNIKTLEPLYPRYISSVDSGNFVGYLFTLKQFLKEVIENDVNNENNKQVSKEKIMRMLDMIEPLIYQTDFSKLYDEEIGLFSIGFNIEENKLTNSYYDLLASEARQVSLVAIALKQVTSKHWNNLSRTLTILNKYKGLISWSGTAFEYLMPNVNIPSYQGSLLDESCQFMLMSQKEYAKKLGIPFGISESAFNLKDLSNNYQYKAFGIPWLGLKRGLSDEQVVSSYGSVLFLEKSPKDVLKNLKRLEKLGIMQKYGMYEAVDFTPVRLKKNQEYAVVKTYMAHHQGLILLSINNLFKDNIFQKRFMKNPQMKAIDILLQERMPENVILTKEEKEKVEKIKYIENGSEYYKEISKPYGKLPQINVLSNNGYTIVMDKKGEGYSKYENIYINRYKSTREELQGIFFYFKNVKTKRIWGAGAMPYLSDADKYNMTFSSYENKLVRQDGSIETVMKNYICAEKPVEIRSLELTNHGLEEETIEVTMALEPVISTIEQDNSHQAFNNLFLNYEYSEEIGALILTRKTRNKNEKQVYLAVALNNESQTIGELEYEIDKEKFYGRNEFGLPKLVANSMPFSKQIGLTTEGIVALKRTITIKPTQTVSLHALISVSETKEQAIENIKELQNEASIKHNLELSKAKLEAENRYLGVSGKELELYQKIATYLIFENPLKKVQMAKEIEDISLSVTKLWEYGISGDLPILLLSIENIDEIEVVTEILKAYNYLRIKNIEIDLVIINKEKYTYESRIKEKIFNCILNENLAYLQNQKGGIFVLDNLSNEDIYFLKARANLCIESSYGSIARYLKELEEEYLDKIKEIALEEKPRMIEEVKPIRQKLENLKYFNEYGGFSEDGKEYLIRVNNEEKLPTVWSHILTNKQFGTLVTESMGGYTWYKNSRLNRVTAWHNNPCIDTPSEIFYLQEVETKKVWSLGLNPCPDENDYYITYGFGYAKYKHNSKGLTQKLEVFVPMESPVKVQIMHLENNELKKKKVKVVYYVKPVLAEDEIKSKGYLNLQFFENSNMVCMQNKAQEPEFKQYLFVSCSEKISSYTGSKASFLGKGGLKDPDGIHKKELDKENSMWQDAAIVIECEVELDALSSKKVIFTMGAENGILECQDLAYKYSNIGKVEEEYAKTKRYWKDVTEKVQVSTPLESTNILLNGWLIYQVLASRMFGRTGYYQSGGAYGFRDQLQDTISLKYVDPNIMKEQIIKHSRYQFEEGDTLHWWHEETKRGIRTRFSDDRLWLVYLVEEYLDFTGDKSILDVQTPYLSGAPLEENVDERYDIYLPKEEQASIYEHCKKAIDISLNFGENGLPKIGSGDWNDGFSEVGNKGKGQSVWLGFFLYDILNRFIPICKENEKENEVVERYTEAMEKLKKALNTNGWDGRWYRRAFTDDGAILGSLQNEECRIDSIAQSWSVISKAGDNDKKYISMESLENHLIDKEHGIIKLLDPPFEKGSIKPGYIASYLPGTRENGGQYTHGAIWAIIAFSILGFGNKAGEYYRMINPIEHARTKDAAGKYKVEPYVISADIYGQKNLAGRGGWSWYTGSASWMFEAGLKYLLGLNIKNRTLRIEPSIPSDWKEYSIKYKYEKSIYHIHISNPNGKTSGVTKFVCDGKEIEEKQIALNPNGGVYSIEIEM